METGHVNVTVSGKPTRYGEFTIEGCARLDENSFFCIGLDPLWAQRSWIMRDGILMNTLATITRVNWASGPVDKSSEVVTYDLDIDYTVPESETQKYDRRMQVRKDLPLDVITEYLDKAYEENRELSPIKALKELYPGEWVFKPCQGGSNEKLATVTWNGVRVWIGRDVRPN